MAEKAQKEIAEILKPEQLQRLKQIEIQVLGAAALMTPEVVKALNITDDQQAKLKTIHYEAVGKRQELMGSLQGLSREEMMAKRAESREKLRQIEKETLEKALAALTPEQREKFEKLKGKKLEVDLSTLLPRGQGRQPAAPGRID